MNVSSSAMQTRVPCLNYLLGNGKSCIFLEKKLKMSTEEMKTLGHIECGSIADSRRSSQAEGYYHKFIPTPSPSNPPDGKPFVRFWNTLSDGANPFESHPLISKKGQ